MSLRATMRRAVQWIADNDDSDIGNVETGYIISICFAADLFGVDVEIIANKVRAFRVFRASNN